MIVKKVSWDAFKAFATQRNASVNYFEDQLSYEIYAIDGFLAVNCNILKDSPESQEFTEDFISNANSRIQEKGTLKLVKVKGSTANGVATLTIKIPGVVGQASRVINGGYGWFGTPHDDDSVEIYISDEDNILGYGPGTIVGGYTETEVAEENKGWYFPKSNPVMTVKALAGMGNLIGGLYLKIIARKGDETADTFRCNIEWGAML